MNLVETYNKNNVYIDDLSIGDIVTVIEFRAGGVPLGKEKGKKYVVTSIRKREPCITGCPNYGYCMTLNEKKWYGMSSDNYEGIACHYILGNKNGVRFRKKP